MHRKVVLVVTLAAGALFFAAGRVRAVENLPAETVAKIDSIAKAWVQTGKSAGLAVGVARDGRMLLARGYGWANLEDRVPVTADTVFRAGSIEKQFTAAAVLLLAQQGKLSLEDRLDKYFPEIPQASTVSIRQLLNHTAGVHNLADGPQADPQLARQMLLDLSPTEVLQIIKSSRPFFDFPAGTAFHYSNTGYMLAGMIVEKVSGRSIAAFLKENIFLPQGLANSAIDNNTAIVAHRAQGYQLADGKAGQFQHAAYVSMNIMQWSGGLRTTTSDLLHWQHLLLTGKVIGGKYLQEMTTPAHLSDGRRTSEGVWPAGEQERGDYGFGLYFLEIAGHKQIIHGGDVNGFEGVVSTSVDDHLSFAVLTNTTGGLSSGKDQDVWLQIAMALLDGQGGKTR
jgi:D-alanyl-D-alanine carboxypeptidase